MRYKTTNHFDRGFRQFPQKIKDAFKKQIGFLLEDIRHPSLRAKKYDEQHGVWQARVTNNVRFYFKIESDVYYFIDIEKHRD